MCDIDLEGLNIELSLTVAIIGCNLVIIQGIIVIQNNKLGQDLKG
jgi:hypothetical protein